MSGNGYHLSQGTSANRPTLTTNQINGHPALLHIANDGDTRNQFLSRATTPAVPQPYTSVVIAKVVENNRGDAVMTDSGSGGAYSILFYEDAADAMALYAGGSLNQGTTNPIDGDFHWFQGDFDGASSELWVDGVAEGTGNPGGDGLTGITVGGDNTGGAGFGGYIAEVLIYDHVLDSGERADLDAYFTARYFPAPDAAPWHYYQMMRRAA